MNGRRILISPSNIKCTDYPGRYCCVQLENNWFLSGCSEILYFSRQYILGVTLFFPHPVAAAKYSQPKLEVFLKYAKVELVPPTPADIPKIRVGIQKILGGIRTGRWKQLTVKVCILFVQSSLMLKVLITMKVSSMLWIYCIGETFYCKISTRFARNSDQLLQNCFCIKVLL